MTATQQPPSPSLIPIDAVVDLAVLALQFGRVDRVTYHEDGTTPESDTDHTVKRLTTRPCRREGCGGVVERRFSKGGGRAKVYCSPACYPSKYQRRSVDRESP